MHPFHENEFYRYYEVVIMETYIYIQTDTRTQHTVQCLTYYVPCGGMKKKSLVYYQFSC